MFWLRNKKIIFLLRTLNLSPAFFIFCFNSDRILIKKIKCLFFYSEKLFFFLFFFDLGVGDGRYHPYSTK